MQNHKDDTIKSQVIIYKGEAFNYFDSGLTRHVFVNESKTKVIKILQDKNSVDYNQQEIDIYKHASAKDKKQMAVTNESYKGFVVEQEYCIPVKFDDRKLTMPQMLFAASCRQDVGWNKKGELVCFDLDEFKKY